MSQSSLGSSALAMGTRVSRKSFKSYLHRTEGIANEKGTTSDMVQLGPNTWRPLAFKVNRHLRVGGSDFIE